MGDIIRSHKNWTMPDRTAIAYYKQTDEHPLNIMQQRFINACVTSSFNTPEKAYLGTYREN